MGDSLLRRAEVERRVGLRRSAIYERIARGTFPAPVPDDDGRTARWLESEIDAYVARVAAGRGGSCGGSLPTPRQDGAVARPAAIGWRSESLRGTFRRRPLSSGEWLQIARCA